MYIPKSPVMTRYPWGLWWCRSQTICRSLFRWRRASGSISLRLVVPWWFRGGWVTGVPCLFQLEILVSGEFYDEQGLLGGGNSNIFGIFTPKFGEDEPILTHMFQLGWLKPPTSSITLLFIDKIQLVSDQKTCCWIKSGTNQINTDVFHRSLFCSMRIENPDICPTLRWALSAEMLGFQRTMPGGSTVGFFVVALICLNKEILEIPLNNSHGTFMESNNGWFCRCLSSFKGPFSGSMLGFGSVFFLSGKNIIVRHHEGYQFGWHFCCLVWPFRTANPTEATWVGPLDKMWQLIFYTPWN